uniref:Transmembrane protein 214 n=1 Tax=Cyprinus carpio carpio TaxID=630221 RepID=A0A9J8CZN8_CYPCA
TEIMASGAGKWEVVKKGKKQNISSSSGGKPQEKKSVRKALSEANTDSSYVMSETIFDGFEKMGKKQNKEQVPPPAETQLKKPSAGKPAKKPPASSSGKPARYKTLEEAVRALDVQELKQQLEKSQSLFPENPCVWVKDLAGYLNYKLPAPDTEPTLSSYAHGESLHGYRMCIQALVQDKPQIVTLNLADHLELLRSHQNRPVKCLTIMWALGQAGFYDLSQGIRVWLGIMLPVLGMKALSAYAIAYLERLLTLHANLTKGFGIMGPKEFFPLLDFAYMPKNTLSPSLQEQLCRLYPRLKVLAFGAKPESTLHTYFPSFLSRATPDCPDSMKKELLRSLTECLTVDGQSLSVWRQLYTKHMPQSSLLLNHLLKSWNTLPPKVRVSHTHRERENLSHTLTLTQTHTLTLTHSQRERESLTHTLTLSHSHTHTLTQTHTKGIVSAVCVSHQSLQQKMHGRGFPWWRVLMMSLVFVAGFITHDIRSQGSFSGSTTALYLERSGVKAVSQQACSKVSHYSQQGASWLAENTPHYYSRVLETTAPLLEDARERMKVTALFLAQRSSELLLWLQENVPLLLQWVSTYSVVILRKNSDCGI